VIFWCALGNISLIPLRKSLEEDALDIRKENASVFRVANNLTALRITNSRVCY
jgi:hypothetical protein